MASRGGTLRGMGWRSCEREVDTGLEEEVGPSFNKSHPESRRDGPVAKSTYWSYRGLRFSS